MLARFLAAWTNCEILSELGDGERQDEQKHPANERYLTKFSVSDAQRDGGGTSGALLASEDTRREFPAVIAPGRGSQEAKPATLRLRVGGENQQAKKEEV